VPHRLCDTIVAADMLPTEELEPVPLRDGGRVTVLVEGSIVITRSDSSGVARGRVELAYPNAGFGGGGTLASPSARHLVVHTYSGQSEETFCLLDLARDLELIAAPDYFFGECGSYTFSPHEDFLVMALPESSCEWWIPWEEDGLEHDEDGTAYRPFATIVTCDCKSGRVIASRLVIVPSVDEPLHTDDYDPDLDPRFIGPRTLRLCMPWGPATIDLPGTRATIRVSYPPPKG
jgi:hypothetical protein